MAITVRDPNTIHLGGDITKVNDLPAATAITPGKLIQRNSSSEYELHGAATAGPATLALNQPELNLTIDDDYAIGDRVNAGTLHSGASGLAWLASGQNVDDGAVLEAAASGNLTALASGVPLFRAIEAKDATFPTGTTRIRVEAL